MSPFEDQNELQHAAEVKEARRTQSVLGVSLQPACSLGKMLGVH